MGVAAAAAAADVMMMLMMSKRMMTMMMMTMINHCSSRWQPMRLSKTLPEPHKRSPGNPCCSQGDPENLQRIQ